MPILIEFIAVKPDSAKSRYDHSLVVLFENKRYQMVNIPAGSNRNDVVKALELLARVIATDDDLK